jgi:cytochrome b involved in lipid metabolism
LSTNFSEPTSTISTSNNKDEILIQTNEEEIAGTSTQTEAPTRKREIVEVNRKLITEEWTLEEIAKHNSEDDCWIIVNNCVYDITAYFSFHPGGKKALIKFAGRDATENVQFHSSKMLMLLNKYFFVGRVAGTTKRWQSGCSIS